MKKICNCCGVVHTKVPVEARVWKENGKVIGYFWECACKSTMFVKAQQ